MFRIIYRGEQPSVITNEETIIDIVDHLPDRYDIDREVVVEGTRIAIIRRYNDEYMPVALTGHAHTLRGLLNYLGGTKELYDVLPVYYNYQKGERIPPDEQKWGHEEKKKFQDALYQLGAIEKDEKKFSSESFAKFVKEQGSYLSRRYCGDMHAKMITSDVYLAFSYIEPEDRDMENYIDVLTRVDGKIVSTRVVTAKESIVDFNGTVDGDTITICWEEGRGNMKTKEVEISH